VAASQIGLLWDSSFAVHTVKYDVFYVSCLIILILFSVELLPFCSKGQHYDVCPATVMCLEPAHIVAYIQASVMSYSCITGTQQILGRGLLVKNDS
jgi:hypothetical protein